MPHIDVSSPEWRAAAAQALWNTGKYEESELFATCGQAFGSFNVLVCDEHPEHEPQIRPLTCKLRYCPECERREQARKLARYVPGFKHLTEEGKPGWSVKHITLTTPYKLDSKYAVSLYPVAWAAVEKCLQTVFLQVFKNDLTAAEKRRQRISYTGHDVSILVAAEFGENSQHLHFHILAYCPFIPKQLLTESWIGATNGECQVNWIKKIEYHDVENSVKEICKYVTKFTSLPPRLIPQLADVLAGNRRFRTYGKIRQWREEDHPATGCPTCSAEQKLIHVTAYAQLCMLKNLLPDPAIVAAAPRVFLDLKLGNKTGDSTSAAAHDPPPDPPMSAQQQRLWDGFDPLQYQ